MAAERSNTIQRALVLQAVRDMRGHMTADEVYEYICKKHPTVGKGTVYRNLSILADEQEIKKVEVPEGPNRYDFNVTEHYHLTCVKCNRIFDVDMDAMPDIMKKVHNTHGMDFLTYDIWFKGICSECK